MKQAASRVHDTTWKNVPTVVHMNGSTLFREIAKVLNLYCMHSLLMDKMRKSLLEIS